MTIKPRAARLMIAYIKHTHGRPMRSVTVKNVSEMRRLMPQFMLDVKAMALPLIPPGKISLSTSQGIGPRPIEKAATYTSKLAKDSHRKDGDTSAGSVTDWYSVRLNPAFSKDAEVISPLLSTSFLLGVSELTLWVVIPLKSSLRVSLLADKFLDP